MTKIILKGNQLGWLIKLAEERLDDPKFIKYLGNNPELKDMLYNLISTFHPTRFIHGTSNTIWTLTDEEREVKSFLINGTNDGDMHIGYNCPWCGELNRTFVTELAEKSLEETSSLECGHCTAKIKFKMVAEK